MKAIKEVAKEQILKIKLNEANVGHILHGESKRINGSLFSDLLSFAEVLLTEAQRWIPVEEELPEQFDNIIQHNLYEYVENPVVVKTSNGRFTVSKRYRFDGGLWYWSGSTSFSNSVTHWRPIERK